MLGRLESAQDEYRSTRWGLVRTVKSMHLVAAEHAVRGLTAPFVAAEEAYQAAKDLAEHYDPTVPFPLNRGSPPVLEEIVGWWRDHLGKEVVAAVAQIEKRAEARKSRPPRRKPLPKDALQRAFPELTRWVAERGWIEVGHHDGFEPEPSHVRVLDEGGMVYQSNKERSLEAALREAERALARRRRLYGSDPEQNRPEDPRVQHRGAEARVHGRESVTPGRARARRRGWRAGADQ
ncbi:MAG: hypothetical protein AB2A00_29930 [Myxococcota bacterium]